ncbi:VirB4-like conjugal transfer ATPase, CD1110 family [Bacillus toyonensis]|uniref:VirB4-like conjugal transfer ATPase, CD1110 family n=1 Tax=Bacillus toyonensis TaxID=155322 RepID=UPI002E1E5529|nr:DUF87 domain-containing protein [Bacillus toyonensis]
MFGIKKQDKGVVKKDILSKGENKINDLIAPDTIQNEKTFYVVGNRLVRTFVVVGYPRTVRMGWLDTLYSYDANIDISIHITPWSRTKVIKTLNKRIGQYMSTLSMDEKNGRITDIEVVTALEDAEDLRDKLHTGISRFFYQAIYISVSARYVDDLDQLTEEIESLCGSMQLTTRIAVLQQDKGFMTVLPIGDDRIRKTRNFDTDSLSTCFPLVSAELTNTEGIPILYGINQINNSLVMFDRFKLNSYNSVTLATSGAGKSYFVKLEAIRHYLMGTKVIVIDPQNEYKAITHALGGQFINLSAHSKDRINPLEISTNVQLEDDSRSFLSTKVMDVFLMIQVMLGKDKKLTPNEKRAILFGIQRMYERFGITDAGIVKDDEDELVIDEEFITVGSTTQKMPVLSDLDTSLREIKDSSEIAKELEPFVTGVMNLFNGETNVDLNNDFVVFGIRDLEQSMTDIAMFICLEYIWNKIKLGDKKRRLIVVDEAWIMLKNESSGRFLEKVAKTARKFNAGLSIISQNVRDFMENGGESIISNTSMQILLKQNPNELHYLEEVLGITESEKGLLRTADRGEALMYVGQNKTLVKIEANEFEHQLCISGAEE